jgi:hypothetical protein
MRNRAQRPFWEYPRIPLAVSCHRMAQKCNSHHGGAASSVGFEQFWGRAVRASRDSEESRDALYIFGEYFWSVCRIGALSAFRAAICPLNPVAHQDEGFCTAVGGAEVGPIRSLRRRERFVANDR